MNDSAEQIPNRFDYETTCAEIYSAWEADGCFHAEPNPKKKPFTIVMPPPNVTGALHLGHALNGTLQDIRVRWHRMRGFETLWMPGTDHAGIATQAVVERRLKEVENKTRHDLGREKLVERIWEWKAEYETRILNQLRSLGCSCDWERTRFTLDDTCARAVRTTFFDLFNRGLIFRGKRLVNWDTFLQTAVSDDEVFHEVKKGHFWHFKYPVVNPAQDQPTHVTIATTRPETMLGDTAVAVHPDPAGALDRYEAELQSKLTSAPAKERPPLEAQLEELRTRRETHLPGLLKLADMARAGVHLRLPLADREIPLVVDEWAKPELGSGCVKITPAHDANDYEVGLRCELPMINILNTDGTLNEAAGKYQGLTMRKARAQVVADLEELGLMVEIEDREIDLAHSDRSKTPIEPLLADQWFVKMEELAQNAIDAVKDGRVTIIPSRYRKGYIDWLKEKRDWPVGRQLWWGHQIPIWTKQFESAEAAMARATLINESETGLAGRISASLEGTDLLHVCIRHEALADGEQGVEADALQSELEKEGFVRQADVLDTWFSSALWPHSTLGWPEKTPEFEYFYPTSTLITSRDIITLWVARMVLMGLNNVGEVPFREVFIHPKILDGYGETMSKSKGNGVDPIDVMDKFGPDALRFGLAWLATETQDVRMPVQFECPHCASAVNQTKQNREKPTIECPSCKKLFSTQWAKSEAETAHPKAAVISERFETARNFCNKLWNAARFVMLHLEGYEPQSLDFAALPLEDRWILSRLSTTIRRVDEALEGYHHSEAARIAYDFAWDEFCSYYVEMAKPRLADPAQRAATQQVLAHTLDQLLRILHPVIPFITEAIWQELAKFGTQRSLDSSTETCRWLMQSSWPQPNAEYQDRTIEAQFAKFASVLGAVREIRSRQNIAPKEQLEFSVRCNSDTKELLQPMLPFFSALAGANCIAMGDVGSLPEIAASISADGMDVTVDLSHFIDVAAEIQRLEKLAENLVKQIKGKQAKLSNESFVSRAPQEVVTKERETLADLEQQLDTAQTALEKLRTA
ncbi:valine--tRNA ligase [Aureliella helgolandensis]|uniref:Valine--tRNA ligase n=1 Tax=Aureliella helgolandensis TaxID=2527968 RepID=A0A518GA22_9BACT|nr:valine--tRNA ligase [Aureliella helgolandensis]QDV25423.1 Valine--tRNA ligase [Aureliella helgolandensis]